MRIIAFALACTLPSSPALAAAPGRSAEPARISLAIGEERSLAAITGGLLSDGATLLAFAELGALDDTVTVAHSAGPAPQAGPEHRVAPLTVSLTQFDIDFRVELVPPGILPAEPERRRLPEPEEEPCRIGLTCRDADL